MLDGLSVVRLKRCRQDAAQTTDQQLPKPLPQAGSADAFVGGLSSRPRPRSHVLRLADISTRLM